MNSNLSNMTAKIYTIVPLPCVACDVGDVYVGSTTQSLSQRFNQHKSNSLRSRCSSAILFEKYGEDKLTIMLLEECPVENRCERERHWIETMGGVNKTIPGRTHAEYRRQHREARIEYMREYNQGHREARLEYYQQNREARIEYMREYRLRKKTSQCNVNATH
jgi:hypothetical protein